MMQINLLNVRKKLTALAALTNLLVASVMVLAARVIFFCRTPSCPRQRQNREKDRETEQRERKSDRTEMKIKRQREIKIERQRERKTERQ